MADDQVGARIYCGMGDGHLVGRRLGGIFDAGMQQDDHDISPIPRRPGLSWTLAGSARRSGHWQACLVSRSNKHQRSRARLP